MSMKSSDNKHPISTYVFVNRIESSQCSDSISIDVKMANEHLVFKGILDSGAEATIVPMKFAQRILEVDSEVVMSKLDPPITLELPNGSKDKISYEMYLDLVLQSKAGKLLVPSRRCLVWDTDSEVILLGVDLLNAIGIDPKSALESIIASTSVEGINECGYKGAEENCTPMIGLNSKDEIDQALCRMVRDAIDNGLSAHLEEPVLRLVMKYKNVWRRSLGPDPPAKVTPLVTKTQSWS